MWFTFAPADAMMVVSEMGEQWSPATAPAKHAEMPMVRSSGSPAKMGSTMGMRMPNVPQLVPVANASPHATRKMMAGSMLNRPAAAPSMQPDTNSAAPSALVMLFS